MPGGRYHPVVVGERGPGWVLPFLVVSVGLVALGAVTAAIRLPTADATVWLEAVTMGGSAMVLLAVAWWLTSRPGVPDRRVVLAWGLGTGAILGVLWIAEIAFNNLTPHSISTASARGVLDNATWAIVGVVTVVVAARVAAATGRWRCGVRAGVWSGVGSGLGAGVGGALLLGFGRPFVERDPLMLAEWRDRAAYVRVSVYVTRETMAGVAGHVWVLGVAQGALLGVLGATAAMILVAVRRRPPQAP